MAESVNAATFVAMTVAGSMALNDAKNHLSEIVDHVEREHDRVVITKHGRPITSFMPLGRRGIDSRRSCGSTTETLRIDHGNTANRPDAWPHPAITPYHGAMSHLERHVR